MNGRLAVSLDLVDQVGANLYGTQAAQANLRPRKELYDQESMAADSGASSCNSVLAPALAVGLWSHLNDPLVV
ncbi:hypothetical protein [Pseudomonas sp. NY15354]|uniref:hypothetical protein n=1 Tax=Pseudomonas sp. NY15354 TaxID=3400351 RepID=UPI003A8C5D85